jgi:hypothetical protein
VQRFDPASRSGETLRKIAYFDHIYAKTAGFPWSLVARAARRRHPLFVNPKV